MILFDLDGTLADCEHRRHFVDPRKNDGFLPFYGAMHVYANIKTGQLFKPDWNAFYEACDQDKPIWPVVSIIETLCAYESLRNGKEIQIWSGRCESVRNKTVHWLKYIIGNSTYSELKMRPTGDLTPYDVLKEKWLDEAIASGKTIDYVFDSHPMCIRMWRRRGIFVFNCLQHDEEF